MIVSVLLYPNRKVWDNFAWLWFGIEGYDKMLILTDFWSHAIMLQAATLVLTFPRYVAEQRSQSTSSSPNLEGLTCLHRYSP